MFINIEEFILYLFKTEEFDILIKFDVFILDVFNSNKEGFKFDFIIVETFSRGILLFFITEVSNLI